jgi:hypothetical protein
MDEKKMKKVLKLQAHERYKYFLEHAVKERKLWALKDSSGWVLFGDQHETSLLTVWPEKDFAETYGKVLSLSCKATAIELNIFLEEWIPKFQDGGVKFLVFPTPDGKGLKVDAKKLKDDLVRKN